LIVEAFSSDSPNSNPEPTTDSMSDQKSDKALKQSHYNFMSKANSIAGIKSQSILQSDPIIPQSHSTLSPLVSLSRLFPGRIGLRPGH
jgi:hypothetical protein